MTELSVEELGTLELDYAPGRVELPAYDEEKTYD